VIDENIATMALSHSIGASVLNAGKEPGCQSIHGVEDTHPLSLGRHCVRELHRRALEPDGIIAMADAACYWYGFPLMDQQPLYGRLGRNNVDRAERTPLLELTNLDKLRRASMIPELRFRLYAGLIW
jgi:hypothetical protein